MAIVAVLAAAACTGARATLGTTVTTAAGAPSPPPIDDSSPTNAAEVTQPAGDTLVEVDVNGTKRQAIVHTPTILPQEVLALVFALHGSDGEASRFEAQTGFDEVSDTNGFLVVYPAGLDLPSGGGTSRSWNAGECCDPASSAGVDDVAFLVKLLDTLESRYPVDPRRVYVAGHSNGAFMAQRLGCERPDRFRAIASVAGALSSSTCAPLQAVPMLQIYGTADQNVAPSSGRASVDTWRAIDGCAETPSIDTDGPVTTSTWSGCTNGAKVTSIEIAGAGHPWPSARIPSPDGQPISIAIDATAVAWEFLSSLPVR